MTNTEILERYIEGNLENDKVKELEEALKKNLQLREDLHVHSLLANFLKDKKEIALRDSLARIIKNSKKEKSLTIRLRPYLTAASIAILISLGTFFTLQINSSTSAEELLSEYYQPYDAPYKLRSDNTSKDNLLIEALQHYEKGDYIGAKSGFQKIHKLEPNNFAVLFYLGITCIETEDYNNAIGSFSKVINDKENLFQEQAEWYLGITLLKEGKTIEAKKQFEAIAKSESFFKEKAKEILTRLRS